MAEHTLTLHTRRINRPGRLPWLRFTGQCSCGDTSLESSAAGMVHGWHARHTDKASEEG